MITGENRVANGYGLVSDVQAATVGGHCCHTGCSVIAAKNTRAANSRGAQGTEVIVNCGMDGPGSGYIVLVDRDRAAIGRAGCAAGAAVGGVRRDGANVTDAAGAA